MLSLSEVLFRSSISESILETELRQPRFFEHHAGWLRSHNSDASIGSISMVLLVGSTGAT